VSSMSIPRVWEVNRPYSDVLEGKATPETFVVNLGGIWERIELGKKVKVADRYLNYREFIKRTVFTPQMKNLIRNVLKRLNGLGADSIYMITVPMGGGKSHTLLLLYYIIKHWGELKDFIVKEVGKDMPDVPRDSRVIVIDGQRIYVEFPDGTRIKTIWGLLYKQLGYYSKEVDSWEYEVQVPELRDLISKKPTLILVDELTSYVAQVAPEKVKYEKVLAFIQALTTAVSESPNSVLIVTIPSGVYVEAESAIIGKVRVITGRFTILEELADTRSRDEVRKRAVFEEYNANTALLVAREYIKALGREGDATLEQTFALAYPYHPFLLNTLRKLREGKALKEVREELRFLASIVYSIFKSKPFDAFTIDIGSADLHDSIVVDTIVSAGAYWREALSEDLDRLEKAFKDETTEHVIRRIFTSIVVNSIPGVEERELGLSEEEIVFAVTNPIYGGEVVRSSIPKILQAGLHMLEYSDEYKRYIYGKPSFQAILQDFKKQIVMSRVNEWWTELEKLVKEKIRELINSASQDNIFRDNELSEIIVWPSKPTEIPDCVKDEKGFLWGKLKLVLMNYAVPLSALDKSLAEELRGEGVEVAELGDYTANLCIEAVEKVVKFMEVDKSRRCLNTLFYLVAETNEVRKIADIMIEYMAIEKMLSSRDDIIQKYGASVVRKAESRKSLLKSELANPYTPYRYLVYPSKPRSQDEPPYSCISLRIEDVLSIKTFLDSIYNELVKMNRLVEKFDPNTFIDLYWPMEGTNKTRLDDFIKYFYEVPGLELPRRPLIILKTITEALKQDKIILVRDNEVVSQPISPYNLRPSDIISREIEKITLKITAKDTSGRQISGLPISISGKEYKTPVEIEVIKGSKVSIKAPSSTLNYEFVEWSDGKQVNEIELVVNEDLELAFIMKPRSIEEKVTLTITVNEGNVKVKINDEEYEITPVSPLVKHVNKGERLSLKVEPLDNYEFIGWSDGSLSIKRELSVDKDLVLRIQLRKKSPGKKTETYKGDLKVLPNVIYKYFERDQKIASITLSIETSNEPIQLLRMLRNIIKEGEALMTYEISEKKSVEGIKDLTFKIEFSAKALDRVESLIRSLSGLTAKSRFSIAKELADPKPISIVVDRNVVQALSELLGEFELKVETIEA